MAIIDNDHATINETSNTFWQDALKNAKILLFEVEKGILATTQGGHQSYDLNSGQGSQSVRRLSLIELRELRSELLYQINDLELKLGIRPICRKVEPGW
jgi:hypothetical protein